MITVVVEGQVWRRRADRFEVTVLEVFPTGMAYIDYRGGVRSITSKGLRHHYELVADRVVG